jgi:hypothetical protein
MSAVNVRMVGGKIIVEVDVLKAIAEGVGGPKLLTTGAKPGPKLGPKPATTSS